jgi:hypothetical protein
MEAQVKADPLPFLQRAADEMGALHRVLVEVETALNDTNWVFGDATAFNVPVDHYKAGTARVKKARDVLAQWMSGKKPHST